MALILALIIGICILIRYTSDKSSRAYYHIEYERMNVRMNQELESFLQYVASKSLTDNMRGSAVLEDYLYRKREPPSTDTIKVREMRKRIREESGIMPTAEMITCALLAQEGLVPYEMGNGKYITTSIEPRRENWKVEHKFFYWLNKELNGHGVPYQIKFIPLLQESSLWDSKGSKVVESVVPNVTSLQAGTYFWYDKQATNGTISKSLIEANRDYYEPFHDY